MPKQRTIPIRRLARASWLAGAVVLAACGQTTDVTPTTSIDPAQAEPVPKSFAQFTDIPVPTRSKIDVEKTLVFGGGEAWVGRLVLETGHGPFDVFDFFKQELPGFGWTEVTTLRAATSVLVYARRQRVATIQIQGATIQGSEVMINVSPQGTPPAGPAAAPMPGSRLR